MFRKFLIFALCAACVGYAWADNGPIWPAPGSDADVVIESNCVAGKPCGADENNIRIVSKIGADLVVENNINMGNSEGQWSGGANQLHGYQAPAGFNVYESQAEMPLFHQEMVEDDGGYVLAASRSNRKARRFGAMQINSEDIKNTGQAAIEVDSADSQPNREIADQVRSWVVANGQTLHEVLQAWCDKEGWDLVWGTEREYPIQASAVFKGRFVDVASAVVRNFSRATPTPYAKFYKGNRVLVITTTNE